MSTSLTKLAVIGSGAMARALAHALQEAPCEVLLWARDSSVLGSGACASLGDVAGADLALMAISDSGLDDLAGRLVEEGCLPAVVLHTSGFHGLGWGAIGQHQGFGSSFRNDMRRLPRSLPRRSFTSSSISK